MGTRLGRYDVIRTLAKGALTDLLLGRASGMEGFQRHVAIKQLREEHATDPQCLESFVNEARLAAALHHHNIVQVLDIGEGDGQPFFAMEYVHGVDLRKLLGHLAKRSEQLPIQHVVSIIASAAAALHHAHEQRGPDGQPLGIVHRQVTPANILVGYDGNVKLVDFGIAKAAIKRIETGVGVLRGSAPYMAPEQCAGRKVDRRSDVFALGIVLYELSTVRRLFKGANEFLTMSAVVNAEVPRPTQYRRDVPSELEVIMLKALARDPVDRYQTAGDMAQALDNVARKVGVGASTTQLANYMKLQFGEQKEPWLVDYGLDAATTEVDFDGAASGLAPPPNEAVKNHAIPRMIAATKSAPVQKARTSVVTPPRPKTTTAPPMDRSFSVPTTVDAGPPIPPPPPPTRPPPPARSAPAAAPAVARTSTPPGRGPGRGAPLAHDPAADGVGEEPPTEVVARTAVASPPPAPAGVPDGAMPALAVASIRSGATVTDPTAIVEPLPVAAGRAGTIESSRTSSKVVLLGGGAALLVAITAAIALWPSSDLQAVPAAAPAGDEVEMRALSPVDDDGAPPAAAPMTEEQTGERSALEMTARDYEAARAAVADAAVAEVSPDAPDDPSDSVAANDDAKPAADDDKTARTDAPEKEKEKEKEKVAAKQADSKSAVRPAPKTTKRTASRPKTKRTKRPVKKKRKPTTKPKWDPTISSSGIDMRHAPFAIALLLAAPLVADAKPKPKAKQAVKAHMARATKAHKSGKFELALTELQAAYAIDPQPKLLFAIAQVQAKLDNCDEAIPNYEKFLAKVKDKQKRAIVRQAIEACTRKLPVAAAQPAATPSDTETDAVFRSHESEGPATEPTVVDTPEPPPAESPPPPAPEPTPPAVDDPPAAVSLGTTPSDPAPRGPSPWYTDVLGDALVVGGVAAGVASVVLYRGAHGDLDRAERADSLAGYEQLVDQARGKRTFAVVLAGGGAALIGAGLLRYALRDTGEQGGVTIAWTAGGGLVTWMGGF